MPDARTEQEIRQAAAVTDERVEEARSHVDDAVLVALLAALLWKGKPGKKPRGKRPVFYWDADALEFRDADGEVVPRDTVVAALDRGIQPFRDQVADAVGELDSEDSTVDEFQDDLEHASALALIVGGALAVGGWRRFGDEPTAGRVGPDLPAPISPRERVEQAISEELPFADDFADEIRDDLAPGKIGPRANQYVESAHRTHERVRRAELIDHVHEQDLEDEEEETDDEEPPKPRVVHEEMRVLNSQNPCRDCPRYSNRWEPLGTLPDIGQECECHSNCKCSFVYRTREIAVMAKKATPELSYNEITSRLTTAIRTAEPRHDNTYVRDVYADRVIYRDWELEKTFERPYTMDGDGVVTLGDSVEVVERTIYEEVVQMSMFALGAGSESDGQVPWIGTIFKAGNYPDRKLSISTGDLDRAVTEFAPCKLNVEHKDSIFSGKFGELSRIWRDGEELKGEVRTPAWFRDDVAEDRTLKVSTEWDIARKKLVGLATALTPRVTGAEMVAVFSRGEAHFVGRRNSKRDQSAIQTIHDHATSLGADCAPKAKMAKGDNDMTTETKASGWDRFKAFFASLTGEERKELGLPETPAATTTTTVPATLSAEMSADDKAKFAALETEVARLRGNRKGEVATAAALFADEQIKAGKATPAERDQLIARFTEEAEDDIDAPRKVTFSAGAETREGTRVDRLRAEFTAKASNGLLEEQVQQDGVAVLSATAPAKKEDEVVAAAKANAEKYAANRNQRAGLKVAR